MSAPPTHADYQLSQLDQLEAESIHIFREAPPSSRSRR